MRLKEHLLTAHRAATHWYESSPLGNGRIGAMLYGDVSQETIVINEKGMWSGSYQDSDREDAAQVLPEIRRLLLEGQNSKAEALINDHYTCKGLGSNYAEGARVPFGCYQMMAYLRLAFFKYTTLDGQDENINAYVRQLDLDTAVASMDFRRGTHAEANVYHREAFVSAPDQVFTMQLTANHPGAISFSARLDRAEAAEVSGDGSDLVLHGQLADGLGTDTGVRFACRLRILAKGGRVWREGATLQVQHADSAVIYLAAITDIRSFSGRRADDPWAQTRADLDAAAAMSYEQLKTRHVDEYRSYDSRMSFALDDRGDTPQELDASARLQRLRDGQSDTGLETLFFHFCRYLFISANRMGELPGNLQGLWAEELQTPWNADWHLNAQQMLFWPAEIGGLPELHLPFLRLTEAIVKPGERTAKLYYNSDGWVVHTFTNAWLFTSPGEEASWGSTTGSAAWQCFHLWDHFIHTGDQTYLNWAYPIMKKAARFYQDLLVEEPKTGYLVTSPSSSPENQFIGPDGKAVAVCMGPTYDNQLLRFLFAACAEAAGILGRDEDCITVWQHLLDRLPPTRIAEDGRIMEWLEPYEEALPHHRHISHLWGAYPGHEISPVRTPALAEAAIRSLKARGTTSAGWSISHRLGVWTRLGMGENAYDCFRRILKNATYPNMLGRCFHSPENDPDPLIPPLTDFFHPFQMDANAGVAGCIPEMLVQGTVLSFGEKWAIEAVLLPSLPEAWPGGQITGVCLPGSVRADVTWKEHRLEQAVLTAERPCRLTVWLDGASVTFTLRAGEQLHIGHDLTQTSVH